jgi:hypothetical protein
VSTTRWIIGVDPAQVQLALAYAQAAKARGSVQALEDLANAYAADLLQPDNGHTPLANAYAHLRAVHEIKQTPVSRIRQDYRETLHVLATALSPTELEWAEAEAQTLLRNPNCCRLEN